jgi:hypothetical protein
MFSFSELQGVLGLCFEIKKLDLGHFLATFGGIDQLFDPGIDLTDSLTRGGKMPEN